MQNEALRVDEEIPTRQRNACEGKDSICTSTPPEPAVAVAVRCPLLSFFVEKKNKAKFLGFRVG